MIAKNSRLMASVKPDCRACLWLILVMWELTSSRISQNVPRRMCMYVLKSPWASFNQPFFIRVTYWPYSTWHCNHGFTQQVRCLHQWQASSFLCSLLCQHYYVVSVTSYSKLCFKTCYVQLPQTFVCWFVNKCQLRSGWRRTLLGTVDVLLYI